MGRPSLSERMFQRRTLWAFCLPFALSACQHIPTLAGPRLSDRDAIARCLPHNIRLNTPLDWQRPQETVEAALIKVGARVGPDGKLYCAAGKPIYFDHHPDGGPVPTPPTEEQKKAAARAYQDLHARYTVITVSYQHC